MTLVKTKTLMTTVMILKAHMKIKINHKLVNTQNKRFNTITHSVYHYKSTIHRKNQDLFRALLSWKGEEKNMRDSNMAACHLVVVAGSCAVVCWFLLGGFVYILLYEGVLYVGKVGLFCNLGLDRHSLYMPWGLGELPQGIFFFFSKSILV